MREGSIYKIGDFARVAQVSVATLRYYEKVGLFLPVEVDQGTGYRFYSLDQLPRLHRLLVLKDLGFSLEQVARLLEEGLSLEHLQGMLMLQRAQTQRMIEGEQARLTRIVARLQQIEQEGKLPVYDVLLKQVDALLVASMREMMPLPGNLGQSAEKLAVHLRQQGIQTDLPIILLLHSKTQQREDGLFIDLETALPLSAPFPGDGQVAVRTLPSGLMACTVHTGADLFLGRAYAALARWIKDNGYRVIGPARQLRLRYDEQMNPARYITEVQYPIEKQI